MIVSWFIATLIISFLTVLINHTSYPSIPVGTTEMFISPSLLPVMMQAIIINLFFWFPAIVYLHKNKKVSLGSSVISSIVAAFIGGVCIIGVGVLFFYVSVADEFPEYTDWTIGQVHYWPGIVSNIVLWVVNGVIFWKLYCKFATSK